MRRRKLSVGPGRTPVMDTLHSQQHPVPRRRPMSTAAIPPGLTRATSRNAAGPVRPAGPPVRLTRRGRVLLTLVFLAALLTVLTVYGSHSAATGEPGTPVPTVTVQVGPGDTLWAIASRVAEPGQTRTMVHRIEELNALDGSSLSVGQEIAVPKR